MTHIHGGLKEKTHGWKGLHYYILEALTENPSVSCDQLLESMETQHTLRKLYHAHGVDHVNSEFRKMFADLKESV